MAFSPKTWWDKPNQRPTVRAKDMNRIERGVAAAAETADAAIPTSSLSTLGRRVCTTAQGQTGTEDGANTWAKILTASTATAYCDAQVLLGFVASNSSAHDTAIVSVIFRANNTGQAPYAAVSILGHGGTGTNLVEGSFRVVHSNTFGSDMELWVKKGAAYGAFAVYELAKNVAGAVTLTYSTNPGWQSASPTGTSLSSNGVTAFGSKVPLLNGSSQLTNDTTGNAATATKLATARSVQTNLASASGASFDGSAAITPGVTGTLPVGNGGTGQTTAAAAITALTGTQVSGQYLRSDGTNAVLSAIQAADVPTLNQSTTGNAATATQLATARTINGVSFDGTANITVADSTKQATSEKDQANGYAGLNADTKLTKDTTGNAATATKLATARTIDGASFDGSAAIITPPARLLAPPSYVSGQYYYCNSQWSATTNASPGNGTVRVTAWLVTAQITVSSLFCEYTAAGNASSVFRIGIWNDDGTGKPGTLLLDAGTIATDGTPAVTEISGLSQVIPPGLYWVGGAVQAAGTTQPTMRITNLSMVPPLPLGTSLPAAGLTQMGWGFAQSGAFTTASSPSSVGWSPRIGFKVT